VTTITTGRPLDADGVPTDGPALELDPVGPAATLFAASPHPLTSSPGLGSWAARIDDAAEDGRPELLVWLAPDATRLPAHVHHDAPETFRAVEGTLTVVVDGDPEHLDAGEELTVAPGQSHTFRNDTEDQVAFRAVLPWRKTLTTQLTVSGLDHEGEFGDPYGEPGLRQALVMAEAISDGTTIEMGPRAVQRVLWATVGRLAKAMGYRAVHDRFLTDAYWKRTVEQPSL
jgi:mannose-6-phosphate isomerase-like protein (cupin superfamily)